jgi:hypothetical protein
LLGTLWSERGDLRRPVVTGQNLSCKSQNPLCATAGPSGSLQNYPNRRTLIAIILGRAMGLMNPLALSHVRGEPDYGGPRHGGRNQDPGSSEYADALRRDSGQCPWARVFEPSGQAHESGKPFHQRASRSINKALLGSLCKAEVDSRQGPSRGWPSTHGVRPARGVQSVPWKKA